MPSADVLYTLCRLYDAKCSLRHLERTSKGIRRAQRKSLGERISRLEKELEAQKQSLGDDAFERPYLDALEEVGMNNGDYVLTAAFLTDVRALRCADRAARDETHPAHLDRVELRTHSTYRHSEQRREDALAHIVREYADAFAQGSAERVLLDSCRREYGPLMHALGA